MGATTGCAECHNHKYDPYTIEDFYQLASFFSDLKQQGAYQAANAIPTTRLPEIQAWSLTQFAQWQALDTRPGQPVAGSRSGSRDCACPFRKKTGTESNLCPLHGQPGRRTQTHACPAKGQLAR